MSANPNSTLSAVLEVATDVPADARVVVTGPEREFTITSPDEPGTDIMIPVVGMRPETTYELSVTATAEGGSEPSEAATESFTTGALPEGFPKTAVLVSDPDRMEPGFTVFDANGIDTDGGSSGLYGGANSGDGYAVAVDADGIPVWYYTSPAVGDIRQLDDGNLLVAVGAARARVIDVLGNAVVDFAGRIAVADAESGEDDPLPPGTIQPETDTLHHEVGMLPNGNIISLSHGLRETEPFDAPVCGDEIDFRGNYRLLDELVVEFDAETGEIISEYSMADLLDVENNSDLMCGGTPRGRGDQLYPSEFHTRTWVHINGVAYDEDRNALIVSAREADLIVAIRYEDDDNGPAGEVLWTFGPDGDVDLEEGEYMYHQHSPEVQPDGSILFLDNGAERPGAEDDPYSRAVRYEIDDSDPENVVARQVWEYVPMIHDEFAYSFFVGDADVLPNGNVLISSGSHAARPIYEVVPDESGEGGEIVWQMAVREPDAIYRAERIATLTPWSQSE